MSVIDDNDQYNKDKIFEDTMGIDLAKLIGELDNKNKRC